MDGNYAGFHLSPARSVWEQVKDLSVKEVLLFFWAPVRVAWIYRSIALGKMDIDTACGIIRTRTVYVVAFKALHDQVMSMGYSGDTSEVPTLTITAIRKMEDRGTTVQELLSKLAKPVAMLASQ